MYPKLQRKKTSWAKSGLKSQGQGSKVKGVKGSHKPGDLTSTPMTHIKT